MPKEFPQIRLNGDKTQAVGHVKRGMLELFKTQSWQELAGVPITKRTVEVDPSTTITVQIAKEQTFIDITSTGEKVVVEEKEEEEEKERYQCPSAFIVRKIDWSNHAAGVKDVKGYLLAYNHGSGKWQIASFTDDIGGGTTPYASNLGWWHNEGGEGHGECDVLTWHGNCSPSFTPPFYNASGIDGDAKSFLSKTLYFRGNAYQAPYNVLGAAILKSGDKQYVYVHSGLIGEKYESSINRTFMKLSSEWVHRKTLSAFIANTGEWETMYFISSTDKFEEWSNRDYRKHIGHPRSVDHVDKDGICTFVREYHSQWDDPDDLKIHHEVYGATKLVQLDMRSGKYEIINDSEVDGATTYHTFSGPTTKQYIPGSTLNYPSGVAQSNQSEQIICPTPWIFHVAPGTKDLYYYGLEVYGNSSKVWNGLNDGEEDDVFFHHLYDTTITCDYTADVVLFKNHKEHDRFTVFRLNGTMQRYENHRGAFSTYGESTTNFTDITGYCRNLFEHIPDVPNSWRAVEKRYDGDYVAINLIEDNKTTQLTGASVPPRPNGDPPLWFDMWPGSTNTADLGRVYINRVQGHRSFLGGGYYMGLSGTYRESTASFTDTVGLTGGVRSYAHDKLENDTWGFALGFTHDYALTQNEWGHPTSFFLKRKDTWGTWMAEAYAVHRPIPKSKNSSRMQVPYLWLRRPIYANHIATEPNSIVTHGDMRLCRLADNGAFNNIPVPDPYDQYAEYDTPTGWYRTDWLFWADEAGYYESNSEVDEDGKPTFPHWKKDDKWELKSNFITKKQLNAMTKDTDGAFLEIGVL